MPSLEELHEQAMDIAEDAFSAQRKGRSEEARQIFLSALALERDAAFAYPLSIESEPSRSILFRSAAALAFNAGDFEQAEQLVSNGLAGFPPLEIRNELRSLRDDIEFRYHILLQGAELSEEKMQMTLWGKATGNGIIAADLLIKRIEQIKAIFYRTVERMAQKPYRASGKPAKSVAEHYNLFLNAFVPGSFGVTFSLGQPSKQLELEFPDFESPLIPASEVINEVITCFELLQENEQDSLQERFKDENYFQNFVALARQMAPDGEAIKVLGLSTYRNGKERTLGFRKSKTEILSTLDKNINLEAKQERKTFKLEGQLKVADSLVVKGDMGRVKLITDDSIIHTIHVPISQMQDVVQPYFDEQVIISGYKKRNSLVLTDIDSQNRTLQMEMNKDSSDTDVSPGLFDKMGSF